MKIILFLFIISSILSADIKEGERVYKENCASCHSVNMTGGLGRDFNLVSYTRRREDIFKYIKNPSSQYKKFGYSANGMPTLPLKDEDIKNVVDYIDSLQPFKEWMKKR